MSEETTTTTTTPPEGTAPAPGTTPTPQGTAPGATPKKPATGAANMTQAGLNERIKRAAETAQRNTLAALGITDPSQLETYKAKIARAEQLEKEAEERKRSEMSEAERLKADLAKMQADLESANRRAAEAEAKAQAEKTDGAIRATAAKYVDPKFVRTARIEFKAYLEGLSPREQERFTDQKMEVWMKRFAKENPEMAATGTGGGTTQPQPTPIVKKPITTGVTPRRGTPPGQPGKGDAEDPTTFNGKTTLPGRPNSMTAAELAEHARRNGIKGYRPTSNERPRAGKPN